MLTLYLLLGSNSPYPWGWINFKREKDDHDADDGPTMLKMGALK